MSKTSRNVGYALLILNALFAVLNFCIWAAGGSGWSFLMSLISTSAATLVYATLKMTETPNV
jgi:hypothetical protein